MIRVKHRANSIQDLAQISSEHGVEIDIRANTTDLYISHDPFTPGCLLSDYLAAYKHELLILNIKEDGLEEAVMDLLSEFDIRQYFFLDQPFPSLRRNLLLDRSCAARVSEYELLPVGLKPISWIWLDSFNGNWDHLIPTIEFAEKNSIKTCLVSPELQGRQSKREIGDLKALLNDYDKQITAVCTKLIEEW
jgi:hypothetical protein